VLCVYAARLMCVGPPQVARPAPRRAPLAAHGMAVPCPDGAWLHASLVRPRAWSAAWYGSGRGRTVWEVVARMLATRATPTCEAAHRPRPPDHYPHIRRAAWRTDWYGTIRRVYLVGSGSVVA
jgi:hypothetical protein